MCASSEELDRQFPRLACDCKYHFHAVDLETAGNDTDTNVLLLSQLTNTPTK